MEEIYSQSLISLIVNYAKKKSEMALSEIRSFRQSYEL